MQFSSISKNSLHLPNLSPFIATSPVPKRSYLQTGTSSSRRLLFDEKFENDNANAVPFDLHFGSHLQKQFQLSYEDDFSKQSDQETEESNSCLRSNPSEGKSSKDKEFMEIEHRNDSELFNSHIQPDQFEFTGSPLLRKKLKTTPFATNMKAFDREILNTPTKKAYSFDPYRGSFSAAVKLRRVEEEGVPRLHTDYKNIEVIGQGSFGKVYRCLNKLDNAEYAIKETLKRFVGKHRVSGLNEIQALASLNALEENTNVVRYYHSWVEDEKLYLVMEYCPMSLKQEMMEKGHFSETELKRILRDICVGLSYLHRNDIVHLDIKPENILISKAKKYKLGDMGQSALAKHSSNDVEEGDARYLAPELLNSDDMALQLTKADVFSLGITLYELATGSSIPMNGQKWHDLRNEKLEKLDKLTTLSDSFKKLIKLMLKRDPIQRPSVQELLTHHLPDQIELELRWEKLQRKLLKQKKEALEQELSGYRKMKRRNSVE